jgi:hypothetical protein
MVYVDKDLWAISLAVPEDDFRYIYVVMDDFDPSRTMMWEPRIDRVLRKGQMPTTDDWGVCLLAHFALL